MNNLVTALALSKEREAHAKAERLAIEEEILEKVKGQLKPEGTTNIGPLKFQTGFTRKWNEAKISDLATKIKPEFFPFKTTFKEDVKKTKAIQTANPDLWNQFSSALTLTPKKTTIKIMEEK